MTDSTPVITPPSDGNGEGWTSRRDPSDRTPVVAGGVVAFVALIVVILATTGSLKAAHPTTTTNAAAAAACNADAKTVETAVAAYDADPPSTCAGDTCIIGRETIGTAPGDIEPGDPNSYGTSQNAQLLLNNEDLSSWPSDQLYAISLTATASAGEVMIYIPPTNTQGVLYDDETGSTGCNAL